MSNDPYGTFDPAWCARAVAPMFETHDWRWCGPGVPAADDIEEEIRRLLTCDASAVETGRLRVHKDESGYVEFYLSVGAGWISADPAALPRTGLHPKEDNDA